MTLIDDVAAFARLTRDGTVRLQHPRCAAREAIEDRDGTSVRRHPIHAKQIPAEPSPMTPQSPLSHRLQMLTVREAAEELNLRPSQILHLIASGLLKPLLLGPNQTRIRILRIQLAPLQRDAFSAANGLDDRK